MKLCAAVLALALVVGDVMAKKSWTWGWKDCEQKCKDYNIGILNTFRQCGAWTFRSNGNIAINDMVNNRPYRDTMKGRCWTKKFVMHKKGETGGKWRFVWGQKNQMCGVHLGRYAGQKGWGNWRKVEVCMGTEKSDVRCTPGPVRR